MRQCCKWSSNGNHISQAIKSVHVHAKQELGVLIAMTSMKKSHMKMIKSVTKTIIGKNKAKNIIEESNEDE